MTAPVRYGLALTAALLSPVAHGMEALEDRGLAETVVVKPEAQPTCADSGCLQPDEAAKKAVEDGKLHANELGRVILYQPFGGEIPAITPPVRLR
jgi:hypothetical protein